MPRKKNRSKVRYARVPAGGETCTFCMMLASRGAVYHTEDTAGGDGHYHANCKCRIVPSWDGSGIEGYDPDEWYRKWKEAEEQEKRAKEEKTAEQEERRIEQEIAELSYRWKPPELPKSFEPANERVEQALQAESNKIYADLSSTERDALDAYSNPSLQPGDGGYLDINSALRGLSTPSRLVESRIGEIDSVMRRCTLDYDLLLYRGDGAKYYQGEIGDRIRLDAFTSTSLKPDTANDFIEEQKRRGNEPVMLEIRAPKGTHAIYLGDNSMVVHQFGTEYEMLLDRGLEYEIIEKTNGRIVLEVKP